MSTSTVPPPERARRPWYLIVALIFTLLFGAGGAVDGCGTIAFYRVPLNFSKAGEEAQNPEERAAIGSALEKFVGALDGAKKRVFPLAAGGLVLGLAMLALGIRALGGQRGARNALVQVVAAQAMLVLVTFFLTTDVRRAKADLQNELQRVDEKFHPKPKPQPELTIRQHMAVQTVWTVLLTFGSSMILVALSRRRSLAFYDQAAAGPASRR